MYEVRNNSIVNEHGNVLAVFLPTQNTWVATANYILTWWHGEDRSVLSVVSKGTDDVVATFDAKTLAAGVVR